MKRFILIAAILAVVGGIVGGIMIYSHYNSDQKLMVRARVKMKAGKYDEAEKLAERYISKAPDDVEGYHLLASAYAHLSRYKEARDTLKAAEDRKIANAKTSILMGDTWADSARRKLRTPEAGSTIQSLEGIALDFKNAASEYKKTTKAKNVKRALDGKQALGRVQAGMAETYHFMSERHKQDVALYKAAGNAEQASESDRLRLEKGDEAAAMLVQAIDTLLAVVQEDPSRNQTAILLVELCLKHHERETTTRIRSALAALGDKAPPEAAAIMVANEAMRIGPDGSRAERDAVLKELDRLVEAHPKMSRIQLERGRLAIFFGDTATAHKMSNMLLANDAKNARGRLMKGQTLIIEGDKESDLKKRLDKYTEAHRVLGDLRLDTDKMGPAHYEFAMATTKMAAVEYRLNTEGIPPQEDRQTDQERVAMAEALRKKDEQETMAITALRQATRGGVYSEARFMAHLTLAKMLLRKYPREAFSDAKACYDLNPEDFRGLAALIEAAAVTEQYGLIRQALIKSEDLTAANPTPEMLLIIQQGWTSLGEEDRAKALADRIATLPSTRLSSRLATVRSLVGVSRLEAAEKALRKAITEHPEEAQLYIEWGRILDNTGRALQALEKYRQAVKMNPASVAVRGVLAQALFRRGHLEQSLRELEEVLRAEPDNIDALFFMAQVRAQMKMPVRPSDLERLQKSGYKRNIALAYLMGGQPDKAIPICESVLANSAKDTDTLVVLARAQLAMNDLDGCRTTLSRIISAKPDDERSYTQLADILSLTQTDPAKIKSDLEGIEGTKPELIGMAMGFLHLKRNEYAQAIAAYDSAMGTKGIRPGVRSMAQLNRSIALAGAKRYDEAIQDLRSLTTNKSWGDQAQLRIADYHVRAGQKPQALGVLNRLCTKALQEKNSGTLYSVMELYVRIQEVDLALETCKKLALVMPEGSHRPDVLRGEILRAAGRGDEAVEAYRAAVEKNEFAFSVRTKLAELLADNGKQKEAVAELEKLTSRQADYGDTAEIMGRMALGRMYFRWGLYEEAQGQLGKLIESGYNKNPAVNLLLGQAYAALGQTEQAQLYLKRVPKHTPSYIQSRLWLAKMEKDPDRQLAVLRALRLDEPKYTEVLLQEVAVLERAGRFDEASLVLDQYYGRHFATRMPPPALAQPTVSLWVKAGEINKAAALCARMFQATGQPGWRSMALCLTCTDRPDVARKMLPPVAEASYFDAAIGFLLNRDSAAKAAPWIARVVTLQDEPLTTQPQTNVPAYMKLLFALATGGKHDKALADFSGKDLLNKIIADELVAHVAKDPKGRDEAATLFKASLATRLYFSSQAHSWAMAALKARPQSLFAGQIAADTTTELKVLNEIAAIVRPADSLFSKAVLGAVLSSQEKYAEAIPLLQEVVKSGHRKSVLSLTLGLSLQAVNRNDEAIKVYRDAWTEIKNPVLANNGAFLLAITAKGDRTKLAEAADWIAEAVNDLPMAHGLRETSGWIAFLQGRHDVAVRDLRMAVRALPNSVQAHSHLGQAEKAIGNTEMARKHLKAATSLYGAIEDKSKKNRETAEAAEQARKALEALAELQEAE